jgi:hypothetical protein
MIAGEKRRAISYAVEFVRFVSGFMLILALALMALHFATAASA